MKLITKNRKSVLLEDEDGYRFSVPKEIYETEDEAEILENSIPYSLMFDEIIGEFIDLEAIKNELYSQGIHTLDDVLKNRKKVNDLLRKNISADRIIKTVKGDM